MTAVVTNTLDPVSFHIFAVQNGSQWVDIVRHGNKAKLLHSISANSKIFALVCVGYHLSI